MKRLIIFFLVTLLPLMAMSQDPITRPSKKPTKTNTTQKPPAKKPSKPQASQSQKPPRQTSQPTTSANTSHEYVVTRPTTGTINGHEYVDLGLSVKWATCNVGASSTSDYGDYFAWGETSPKSEYTEENSETYGKSMEDIAGSSLYDAARANWGSTWRLPTKKECKELVDKCTWTWTSEGGHNGYRVSSKTNSNSIFLPAAGWRLGASLGGDGAYGNYWSSTPNEGNTRDAYDLYFASSGHRVLWFNRDEGFSVRPVSD